MTCDVFGGTLKETLLNLLNLSHFSLNGCTSVLVNMSYFISRIL